MSILTIITCFWRLLREISRETASAIVGTCFAVVKFSLPRLRLNRYE